LAGSQLLRTFPLDYDVRRQARYQPVHFGVLGAGRLSPGSPPLLPDRWGGRCRRGHLTTPGKYVSLSFWGDEEPVRQWRYVEGHRRAQSAGRAGIFADYRLRVAPVVRDYGMHAREQAPQKPPGEEPLV
jgi:hypothetical protein